MASLEYNVNTTILIHRCTDVASELEIKLTRRHKIIEQLKFLKSATEKIDKHREEILKNCKISLNFLSDFPKYEFDRDNKILSIFFYNSEFPVHINLNKCATTSIYNTIINSPHDIYVLNIKNTFYACLRWETFNLPLEEELDSEFRALDAVHSNNKRKLNLLWMQYMPKQNDRIVVKFKTKDSEYVSKVVVEGTNEDKTMFRVCTEKNKKIAYVDYQDLICYQKPKFKL